MRLVCVSDTHYYGGQLPSIPDGDVLIHAGDLTGRGTFPQLAAAGNWLISLPHKHKLVVAGNHDYLFQTDQGLARAAIHDGHHGVHYLQDQVVVIDNTIFYGSPWSVRFGNWAFGLWPGKQARERWEMMPEGVDVLITHGPPSGILDDAPGNPRLGCRDLLAVVQQRQPKVHVFGHIHESHGQKQVGETLFVNAAICDEAYKQTFKPIVVDL